MYCGNCGAQIPDDAVFCGNCGARVDQSGSGQGNAWNGGNAGNDSTYNAGQAQPAQDSYANVNQGMAFDPNNVPEEYRPLTMWGYFGYEILFAIPIVGWIVLIVFAITAKNRNLRNFARSYFCFLIIGIIIALIIVVAIL